MLGRKVFPGRKRTHDFNRVYRFQVG